MADHGGEPKILQYRPTLGAAISEYGVMASPSFKKLAMVESQKPTCHRYLTTLVCFY